MTFGYTFFEYYGVYHYAISDKWLRAMGPEKCAMVSKKKKKLSRNGYWFPHI